MPPLPNRLRELFDRWTADGRPAAVASSWSRDRWTSIGVRVPGDLAASPIDRGEVVRWAGKVAIGDQASQLNAFVVTMVWGFGPGSLGPFRTHRIMTQPRFVEQLAEVTETALSNGGTAAFRQIYRRRWVDGLGTSYLGYLGPSFGTKYLYALTKAYRPTEVTPVLDDVVKRWFRINSPSVDVQIDQQWGYPSRYEAYVETLQAWASAMVIAPDEVEHLIFADQQASEGGVWSESWLASNSPVSADQLLDQLGHVLAAAGVDERAEAALIELSSIVESLATPTSPADDGEDR